MYILVFNNGIELQTIVLKQQKYTFYNIPKRFLKGSKVTAVVEF